MAFNHTKSYQPFILIKWQARAILSVKGKYCPEKGGLVDGYKSLG
jgi:hypothetical protein